MDFLIPAAIPVLSFVLQAYPRLINKYFGVDVWTRMLEVDHIRRNNHKIPHKKLSGQFMIPGYFDYPPLFPTILSYLPKKTLLTYQGYIAPFFDALCVVLIYVVTIYLGGAKETALLAQFLYMLTPMIAIENSSLTPRSFGYLMFYLTMFPLLIYLMNGNPVMLVTGIFFASLLFLAHRFALQSFFFFSIFATFVLNTPVFIQVFIIAFGIALLFTNGYYLRVLKGHLSNIYFWILNNKYRWSHQVRGNKKTQKQADWVAQVYQFMNTIPPVALSILNPWSLSAFIAWGTSMYGIIPIHTSSYLLSIWILFFFIFGSIVMKSRALVPIGEGYRYMEMASAPSAILSAFLIFSQSSKPYFPTIYMFVGFVCTLCLSAILAGQIKGIFKDRNRSMTPELQEVFDYINSLKTPLRIICIPHQNTTVTIFNTKAHVLVNADNPGLLQIQDIYPILTKSLFEIARKYNTTHALIKESFVSLSELGLSENNVVFRSGDVVVAKISASPTKRHK